MQFFLEDKSGIKKAKEEKKKEKWNDLKYLRKRFKISLFFSLLLSAISLSMMTLEFLEAKPGVIKSLNHNPVLLVIFIPVYFMPPVITDVITTYDYLKAREAQLSLLDPIKPVVLIKPNIQSMHVKLYGIPFLVLALLGLFWFATGLVILLFGIFVVFYLQMLYIAKNLMLFLLEFTERRIQDKGKLRMFLVLLVL